MKKQLPSDWCSVKPFPTDFLVRSSDLFSWDHQFVVVGWLARLYEP